MEVGDEVLSNRLAAHTSEREILDYAKVASLQ